MAKDILVNTQSGDLVIAANSPRTTFWNVVWGKLFDSDDSDYMNVVVPSGYISSVKYTDNQFECLVSAEYHPENQPLLIRLVVENIATGKYDLIQNYNINAPEETPVVYYPTYTSRPQNINACQLPIIDTDGKFRVLFKQYGNLSRAVIASAKDADFTIGNSESQSVQLLARCAPGKYYRYPTTGLDLTKYINSVVEHTDMTTELVKQYSSDSKQIIEAEFDSGTGDLQIVFSGTDDSVDNNLLDPSKLDIELFRIADDEFIRNAYKEAHNIAGDDSDFLNTLITTSSFMGLYDIGKTAQLDEIEHNVVNGTLRADGVILDSESFIDTVKLEAGRVYVINYPSSVIIQETSRTLGWQHGALYALYMDEQAVYVDEPFITSSQLEYLQYVDSFINRRCFIPLVDLTAKCYAGADENWIIDNGYGIYPLLNKAGNYDSILGLIENPTTGKLSGTTTFNSLIEDVKVDTKTNQLLIIKRSK